MKSIPGRRSTLFVALNVSLEATQHWKLVCMESSRDESIGENLLHFELGMVWSCKAASRRIIKVIQCQHFMS
jgi:hypothetical protein